MAAKQLDEKADGLIWRVDGWEQKGKKGENRVKGGGGARQREPNPEKPLEQKPLRIMHVSTV